MIDNTLFAAMFTALLTLIGTIITVRAGNSKIAHEIAQHNAVQDERIAELTREVRRHNNFAERIPIVETKIISLEERIARLENKGG
jgi:uncharacterized membrane protein YecN with MAPEG domain